MIIYDAVHITADNTNVFAGRLGEDVPSWARRGRVQLCASDSDWTFDLFVGGLELARDAAPSRVSPLTDQKSDWQSAHYEFDVVRGRTTFDVLLDINVVTAGEGIAFLQWES